MSFSFLIFYRSAERYKLFAQGQREWMYDCGSVYLICHMLNLQSDFFEKSIDLQGQKYFTLETLSCFLKKWFLLLLKALSRSENDTEKACQGSSGR